MRTANILEILTKLSSQLLPLDEKCRMGIILGVNERVTVEKAYDYIPTWEDLLPNTDLLEALDLPILIVYSQWTSWREKTADTACSPQEIGKEIQDQLGELTDCQRQAAYQKLLQQDKSHQFPFGRMRGHVLNHPSSEKFLKDMEGATRTPVYVHIQDSDFTDLQTQPLFSPCPLPLASRPTPFLFKHFDALIAYRLSEGVMPLLVGGAHVYSPGEEIEDTSEDSRYWTRFGSEVGNKAKQIMGRYQPYGLYFHEPNSLVLSPHSLAFVQLGDSAAILKKQYPCFSFGIDSEMQEFSRNIMNGLPDSACRQLMMFSARAVLATSMQRGGSQRNFSIDYDGTYNKRTTRFENWTMASIRSIHGMPQEILHPNKWACSMCTSWKQHRVRDSRKQIANLFNMFDPYKLSQGQTQQIFWRNLVQFDALILVRRADIKALFSFLGTAYDKQGKGNLVAFYMLSQAWETGQMMRLMFLDHLKKPLESPSAPKLIDTRKFLSLGEQYQKTSSYLVVPNSFIIEILELNKVPRPFSRAYIVEKFVRFTYSHHRNNKAKTARLLGTSPSTITKLLKQTSPQTAKKIYTALREIGTEELCEKYEIPVEELLQLKKELF